MDKVVLLHIVKNTASKTLNHARWFVLADNACNNIDVCTKSLDFVPYVADQNGTSSTAFQMRGRSLNLEFVLERTFLATSVINLATS